MLRSDEGNPRTHPEVSLMRGACKWLVLLTVIVTGNIANAFAANEPNIPSGFLAYPPRNGFIFEAVHLLPMRNDYLLVVEMEDGDVGVGSRVVQAAMARSSKEALQQGDQRESERAAQARLAAVPDHLVKEFKAAYASSSGDGAFATGNHLPAAIRLYTAAAVDFHVAHPSIVMRQSDENGAAGPMDSEQRASLEKAIPRFQSVLDLPDAERRSRGVASAYMLGRSYALRAAPGDAALAEKAFVLTRTLARAGYPDPDGLAVASFGEQARLLRAAGDLASTVGLYAEQAARGSIEGVDSLKWVAQALYDDPDGMAKVENIPLGQRLLIAYALERANTGWGNNYVYSPEEHRSLAENDGVLDQILRTAKRWPREKIAMPDRLATVAYRRGDLDYVHALVDERETALAWWIKAKLFVVGDKLADAEFAYKRVVALSPAVPDPDGLSSSNEIAACSELTQLERSRGEFIAAIKDQIACDKSYEGFGTGLTGYLVDRVLSTGEARAIVDAFPPPSSDSANWSIDSDRGELRSVLAQRLMREGRYDDALAYANALYPASTPDLSGDTGLSLSIKNERDLMTAYGVSVRKTESASSPLARAAAWYQLALLTRIHNAQIMGHDSPENEDEGAPDFPHASFAERVRLKENYRAPARKGLHWFLAFDEALKAAELTPRHSQAYAAILCHAGHWMKQAPDRESAEASSRLHQAWQLYLRNGSYFPWAAHFGSHCPDPDFAAASRPAWSQRLDGLAVRIHRHRVAIAGVMMSLLILAALAWLLRRRIVRARTHLN
jgi:cellulose synthase operon protein C